MLGDFVRGFGRKRLPSGMNGSDRFCEFLVDRIFQQVTLRSCFECAKDLYIAFLGRQHDYLRIGKFCSNRDDGIEAIHLRHLHIHERDIRTMRTELLDRLTSIRGFGYQSQIRFTTDEYGYTLSYENMIVHCKNPYWSVGLSHVLSFPSHLFLWPSAFQSTRKAAPTSRTLSPLEY